MTATAESRGIGFGADGAAREERRSWSVAERQRIVDAALAPGASVASVARANDVNANQVFKWIRRSREGWRDRRCGAGKRTSKSAISSPDASERPTFVPVRLAAPEPAATTLAPAEKEGAPSSRHDAPSAARRGTIEIRMPNGARVRAEAGVDGEVLRLVLSTLSEA
jgi:transposase